MLVRCIDSLGSAYIVQGQIYNAKVYYQGEGYYHLTTLDGKPIDGGWSTYRFVVVGNTPNRCSVCDALTPGRTLCCDHKDNK